MSVADGRRHSAPTRSARAARRARRGLTGRAAPYWGTRAAPPPPKLIECRPPQNVARMPPSVFA
jgi:hypothetical protein